MTYVIGEPYTACFVLLPFTVTLLFIYFSLQSFDLVGMTDIEEQAVDYLSEGAILSSNVSQR